MFGKGLPNGAQYAPGQLHKQRKDEQRVEDQLNEIYIVKLRRVESANAIEEEIAEQAPAEIDEKGWEAMDYAALD
jgi:hypothetical protein